MKILNKAVTEQWIQALTSGEYQQGRQFLKGPNNRYCCMGVLCDLYQKTHPSEGRWIEEEFKISRFTVSVGGFGEEYYPPIPVQSWAGLSSMTKLARMNDDMGMTFAEIAGWLTEQLANQEQLLSTPTEKK
jgi:hypothetical protein